jgi:hypothetical protein
MSVSLRFPATFETCSVREAKNSGVGRVLAVIVIVTVSLFMVVVYLVSVPVFLVTLDCLLCQLCRDRFNQFVSIHAALPFSGM